MKIVAVIVAILCLFKCPITFCSYPKGGTFTTKLDLKNQCLMNHKTVFGTRKPAFWVGAVERNLR